MEIAPQILHAKVMHKRLFPKENAFQYGVYYLALPLDGLSDESMNARLPINRFAPVSFHTKDHGERNDEPLSDWLTSILTSYHLNDRIKHVMLICMPRILGYVFNPVSFWLCLDEHKQLCAVICEVHNTFGEAHSYVCAHADRRPITSNDWMQAEKLFHVSPFLEREGSYQFRFALEGEKLGIWIDFYDEAGEKKLLTSLVGTLTPLSKPALRHAFWSHPLVTLKTICLIHWQALRLVVKGIRYMNKPKQKEVRISTTTTLESRKS
ncbi:MAG: DUF1365 domain-containing protein [Rickettsiales bacterium]|nr:DUF1365 domain-containing protein [Rickettsiales bacterium]